MSRLTPKPVLRLYLLVVLLLAAALASDPLAFAEVTLVDPATADIGTDTTGATDEAVATQIRNVFSRIESLQQVDVESVHGVVVLSGFVPNEASAVRAVEIASRMRGVVAVEDTTERTFTLRENAAPLLTSFAQRVESWMKATPLLLAAIALFASVSFVAHRIAVWDDLWSRLTPNPFLAQLASQAVRVAGVVLALVLALNLLGASALTGTILGSAGVVGLAISFGVKDSIENYISSIMLSIRQPFRAQDHVVINEFEGLVIRLTSRSTVLMTLDGNHVRIPNAIVYKSPILNYTRNPQRRLEFVLGVDPADDPAEAMRVGAETLLGLDWVLAEPDPLAVIESVGDSTILIKFMAWIDQRETDFGKARSLCIRATKNALEEQGFGLPEPTYRLKLNQALPNPQDASPAPPSKPEPAATKPVATAPDTSAEIDVAPETHLNEKVREEIALTAEEDLLDSSRPVE
ncbi:MAG: mechanosensitive ion channel family protein [Halioglobus sp.]